MDDETLVPEPKHSVFAAWRWKWWTWAAMVAFLLVIYLLLVPPMIFFNLDTPPLPFDVCWREPALWLSKRNWVVRMVYRWEWKTLEDWTNSSRHFEYDRGQNRRYLDDDFR